VQLALRINGIKVETASALQVAMPRQRVAKGAKKMREQEVRIQTHSAVACQCSVNMQ